jgi:lipopolysaccharide biosynthesis regulator YciM
LLLLLLLLPAFANAWPAKKTKRAKENKQEASNKTSIAHDGVDFLKNMFSSLVVFLSF